jgi:hypothetical protein
MALDKASLVSTLTNIYSSQNTISSAATRTAQAIADYWATGTSIPPFNGVVDASAATSSMKSAFIGIWSSSPPSKEIAAQKMGNVIDTAFLGLIITGGTHGLGGIKLTVKADLISGITDSYINKTTAALHASAFANTIEAHSITSEVFGTGVAPAWIPPTGPLV